MRHSYEDEPFLPRRAPWVRGRNGKRIPKRARRFVESDAVFGGIQLGLVAIPGKSKAQTGLSRLIRATRSTRWSQRRPSGNVW